MDSQDFRVLTSYEFTQGIRIRQSLAHSLYGLILRLQRPFLCRISKYLSNLVSRLVRLFVCRFFACKTKRFTSEYARSDLIFMSRASILSSACVLFSACNRYYFVLYDPCRRYFKRKNLRGGRGKPVSTTARSYWCLLCVWHIGQARGRLGCVRAANTARERLYRCEPASCH